MGDPIWISGKLALAIHSWELAKYGGMGGVREAGLLQSADVSDSQSTDMTAPKQDRYTAFLSLAAGDWGEPTFTVWLLEHTLPATV